MAITKVFIVEDDLILSELLEIVLKKFGWEINIFYNAEPVLVKLKETIPDVIILDIMMPNMDGYELCRRIKSQSEWQNIPIIFLSALAQQHEVEKGLRAGAVAYITKPFQIQSLIDKIYEVLNKDNDKE